MPESQEDDSGALSTAPIFDDTVYLSEALGLPIGQTEDDVDAELALLATESGIQDPYLFLCPPQDISRALSTVTLDSDHRSSLSIHSQETQSTSFTSAPSRTSKDQANHIERLPVMRTPPRVARASPTVEQQELGNPRLQASKIDRRKRHCLRANLFSTTPSYPPVLGTEGSGAQVCLACSEETPGTNSPRASLHHTN
jgi:hypothetical protein